MSFDTRQFKHIERAGYDRLGPRYLAAAATRHEIATALLDAASLAPGQRVLDLASGPGLLAQGPLVLTVLTGFVGVVLMLRPSLDQNQAFAGMIGLMSGLSAAFAYMQVVALSRLGEPESRTVFYFAVGSAVAGGFAMLFTGTRHFRH